MELLCALLSFPIKWKCCSIYLKGLICGLSKVIVRKRLALCVAPTKCFINVKCYYHYLPLYFQSLEQKPGQKKKEK